MRNTMINQSLNQEGWLDPAAAERAEVDKHEKCSVYRLMCCMALGQPGPRNADAAGAPRPPGQHPSSALL